MARLTMAERKDIPKSQFGNPSKAPGPGSFPLENRAHVAAAERYIRYANPATAARIRAKAASMGMGDDTHKKVAAAVRAKFSEIKQKKKV